MSDNNTFQIFIVDDDRFFREMLTSKLSENDDYEVSAFSTGEACLEKMDKAPDVIILDYFLNSVDKEAADGLQILELIRKQKPSQPVVILSSQDSYGIALQTIGRGACYYIVKDEEAFSKADELVREILNE